jgi:hypothetical protein
MLFTNLGRVVAVLALLGGIFYIAGGLMIGAGWLAPEQAVLARYFPGARPLGAVIDRGFYMIPLFHRTWDTDRD